MPRERKLNMILPKGRIQDKVLRILARIGIEFILSDRSYRPECSDPAITAKMLKPQNIPKLVNLGRHDCGFTGYDCIVEQGADVVELADLGFDPVEVVVAVPAKLAAKQAWRRQPVVVASEYQNLAKSFIEKNGLEAVFLRTHGATEAMPPEDADIIIDNTATGATLWHNQLVIVERIMRSTTRFIGNPTSLQDPWKRNRLKEMVTLMRGVLMADSRVLLEMNVPPDCFEGVIAILPCMRAPTVSPLHNNSGFAVKAAVPIQNVPRLIPRLIAAGAVDILEYRLEKIVGAPAGMSEGEIF